MVNQNRDGKMSRILIVDDDLGYSCLLSWLLKDNGYIVDHTFDADSALEMINDSHYDALIIDQWLSGCSGIDMVRRLREANNRTGVILVTCLLPWELDQKTEGLEVWSVIEKMQVDKQEFLDVIEDAIRFTQVSSAGVNA